METTNLFKSVMQSGLETKENSMEIDQRKSIAKLDDYLRNRFQVFPVDLNSPESTRIFDEDPVFQQKPISFSEDDEYQKRRNEFIIREISIKLKSMGLDESKALSPFTFSFSSDFSKTDSKDSLKTHFKSLTNGNNEEKSAQNDKNASIEEDLELGYSSDTSTLETIESGSDDSKGQGQQVCQEKGFRKKAKAENANKFVLQYFDTDVASLKMSPQSAATLLESFTHIKHLLKGLSWSKLIEELKDSNKTKRVCFIIITGLESANELETKCYQLLRYLSYFEKKKLSERNVQYIYILATDSDLNFFKDFQNLPTKIEEIEKNMKDETISRREKKSLKSQAVLLQLLEKCFQGFQVPLFLIDPFKNSKILSLSSIEKNSDKSHNSEEEGEDNIDMEKLMAEFDKIIQVTNSQALAIEQSKKS